MYNNYQNKDFILGHPFFTFDPGVHLYGFKNCIAFQCRPLLDPFHVLTE